MKNILTNNHMTVTLDETKCCGVKEIDGLSYTDTPQEALKDVWDSYHNRGNDCRFMIFTGVTNEKYGQKFRNLIIKEKLGKVIETESKVNPNSDNPIKVWVWTINKTNFKNYARKNKILT